MTILQDREVDCQEVSKESALSVLTIARELSQRKLVIYDLEDTEGILLAAIFNRLDKLVTIVEKIKIPRFLL